LEESTIEAELSSAFDISMFSPLEEPVTVARAPILNQNDQGADANLGLEGEGCVHRDPDGFATAMSQDGSFSGKASRESESTE
jgi:hypothetical protein